jgi:hypothetical protein
MRKAAIINGSLYFSVVNTAMPEAATWIRLGVLLELLWSGVAGAATLTLEAAVSPAWVERAGGALDVTQGAFRFDCCCGR